MENGFIGEIRIFGGTFQPQGWAYCIGTSVNISSNAALYTILGTTFGGNGTSTFFLPNLQGLAVIGTGQGQGLSPYVLGQKVGAESSLLDISNVPAHTHPASAQPATASATATLYGTNDPGDQTSPVGNILATDTNAGAASYASAGTGAPMNAGSIEVKLSSAPLPTVTLGATGGGQAHDNRQPSLPMFFMICLNGEFPTRN